MKYYQVLYSEEYSKKRGKYGIIDTNLQAFDYSLLQNCKKFPIELINKMKFTFVGSNSEEFADYQMVIDPIRLISSKMYKILKKFSDNNTILYHQIAIQKDNINYEYYIMHFKKYLKVLDSDRMGSLGAFHPYIFEDKVKDQNIFVYNDEYPTDFCISEIVYLELLSSEISGCFFKSIDLS